MAAPELPFEVERLHLISSLERLHFWFLARHGLVERLLNRHAVSRSRAIDIGCGTGLIAGDLAEAGGRVLAVDLHASGLQQARAVHPALWAAVADANRLPAPNGAFDVALALDVLEHTDDEAALGEIVRVLKPGGVVVVTVPAFSWLWSARDRLAGHRRRYTRTRLARLLRGANLQVVEIRYYQCLLLPAFIASRLIGRRWSGACGIEERPAGWLNRACLAINRFETKTGDLIRWPWGSSLAAVGCKSQ